MRNNRVYLATVVASMGVVALLLSTVGFAAIHTAYQQASHFEQVSRAYLVKGIVSTIVETVRTASMAERGYTISGDDSYLPKLEEQTASLPADLARLGQLVENNLSQKFLYINFESIVSDRIVEIHRIVALRAEGNVAGAQKGLVSILSIRQLEALAQTADELQDGEDALLSAEMATVQLDTQFKERLILILLGASYLVIALSCYFAFRDVCRRLRAEAALRDSSANLEDALLFQTALVDSAGYGIVATDQDCLITTFNRAAEQLYGYKAEELVGKSTPAPFNTPEEVIKRAAELSNELGRTVEPGLDALVAIPNLGRMEEREWTLIRKNGEHFPGLVSVTAIRGKDEKIKGYIGMTKDISDRRKIERLKSEFISTVSHELRTPLTSIRGSLGLVLGGITGELAPQSRELLNVANNNAERLSRLINDILDIEKIESGKLEFKLQPQFLATLLQQAVDGTRDYAHPYNVTLDLVNHAPEARVNVDADRFIQVMVNLLSNAAKFSPRDHSVTVAAEHRGDRVRVSVADHGKGIPAEFQSHIFEKFAQADSSDTRAKSGTGLGLSITKAIVERMGGTIGFVTQEEFGTTFYVDLPNVKVAA